MKGNLTYKLNEPLSLQAARRFYQESTLAGQRPVDFSDTMLQMLNCPNLIITAWDGYQLVGIVRTMTDFCYIAYLADLAVHKAYQNSGIERRLIIETQVQLAPYCKIVILGVTDEPNEYNRIGFTEHKPTYITKAINCVVL